VTLFFRGSGTGRAVPSRDPRRRTVACPRLGSSIFTTSAPWSHHHRAERPGSWSDRSSTRTPRAASSRSPLEISCDILISPMEKGFPISPDRAIFLADAHLNQEDIHTRNFLALADRAAVEKIPLFLLGMSSTSGSATPGSPSGSRNRSSNSYGSCAGGVAPVLRGGEPRLLPEAGTRGGRRSTSSPRGSVRAVGNKRLVLSHGTR